MDTVGLLAGVAGLLTAVGSFVGALVLLRKAREERGRIEAERSKIEAERGRIEAETSSLAKKSDLDRAMVLLDLVQRDNERLRTRLAEMESREERRYQEILTLKTGILLLINQLRSLGVDPAWKPEWAAECLADERETK